VKVSKKAFRSRSKRLLLEARNRCVGKGKVEKLFGGRNLAGANGGLRGWGARPGANVNESEVIKETQY